MTQKFEIWKFILPDSLVRDSELRRRTGTEPVELSVDRNCRLLLSCSSKNSEIRMNDLTTCDVDALQMMACIWSHFELTVAVNFGPLYVYISIEYLKNFDHTDERYEGEK